MSTTRKHQLTVLLNDEENELIEKGMVEYIKIHNKIISKPAYFRHIAFSNGKLSSQPEIMSPPDDDTILPDKPMPPADKLITDGEQPKEAEEENPWDLKLDF